ncbi:hypothetical protein CsSME_00035051 [Camellia sinensis var. sinensis]
MTQSIFDKIAIKWIFNKSFQIWTLIYVSHCTRENRSKRSRGSELFNARGYPRACYNGTEAVIPLEVRILGIRTHGVEDGTNEAFLTRDLDLLEERRERSAIRLGAYQQQLARVYNKKVKPREFKVGELVLRKVVGNKKDPREGKLGLNWEGPYRIISVASSGAYRLKDTDGKELPRPWNTCNLKYFYH